MRADTGFGSCEDARRAGAITNTHTHGNGRSNTGAGENMRSKRTKNRTTRNAPSQEASTRLRFAHEAVRQLHTRHYSVSVHSRQADLKDVAIGRADHLLGAICRRRGALHFRHRGCVALAADFFPLPEQLLFLLEQLHPLLQQLLHLLLLCRVGHAQRQHSPREAAWMQPAAPQGRCHALRARRCRDLAQPSQAPGHRPGRKRLRRADKRAQHC